MLFVIVTGPSYEKARATIQEQERYADGFEFRLDLFERLDLHEISRLMQQTDRPILFTLRKPSEGGCYRGSETERKAQIRELLTLKPAYFDLEWDTDSSFAHFSHTRLIISYHNFEKTPEDLPRLLAEMQKREAFAYKIAVRARSTLDALRLLRFVKERENLIGIAMGEEGEITRLLGPVVGNVIDYASEEAVAPGQLTPKALCETFRYRSLNRDTKVYGLIGDPIAKSISPAIWNRLFTVCRWNALYVKMRIVPEELAEFFRLIKDLPFWGFSATMPLKEKIAPYLDESHTESGAINTIVRKGRTYSGFNTDGRGALDALEAKKKVKAERLVILGAGGAAKAIAFEAKKRGAHLVLVNRTLEKAQELAETLSCDVYSYAEMPQLCRKGYDILINTTPLGMPIDSQFILPEKVIMDIVTRPQKTPLLQEAEKKRCTLVYGYEMWVYQAVLQCQLWFEKEALDPYLVKEVFTQGQLMN